MKKLLVMGFAILLFACCQGPSNGSSTPPPLWVADINGSWSGTWTSTESTATGTITVTIVQLSGASNFSGNLTLTGSPCFSDSLISVGTISEDTVSWGAMSIGFFKGIVSGSLITGTYIVTMPGACVGDTGTFSITKS